MAEGGNPAEIVICYDVDRDDLKRSALGALKVVTVTFCQIASDRYDWFDPKPLWQFVECVQLWATGTVSVRAWIRAESLLRIAHGEICGVMSTAEKEMEPAVSSSNEERDVFIYSKRMAGASLKEIRSEVNYQSVAKKWQRLESLQAVEQAINRHCDRKRLPLPRHKRSTNKGD